MGDDQKSKSSMLLASKVVSSACVFIELLSVIVIVPRFGTSKVAPTSFLIVPFDHALGEVRGQPAFVVGRPELERLHGAVLDEVAHLARQAEAGDVHLVGDAARLHDLRRRRDADRGRRDHARAGSG